MRTLLIFPPQAHFTQPYLALPSLVGWLKHNGFADTHQLDVNLASVHHFLSRERLMLARDRVRQRLAVFAGDRALDLRDMDRFRTLAEADIAADSVIDGIEDALAVLRDGRRFFEYDTYIKAVKRVDRAFKLISAEWYPTVVSANSFAMAWSIERESDVLAAIHDEAHNPYIEYYRDVVLPQIVALQPDLVGLSITYGSMIVPGFTLARMIRAALPDVHITIGGGLLAYAGEKIARSGRVFDVIDSMVLLEGEGPLLGLARALRDGTSLDAVPNIIHRRAGEVVKNPTAPPLDIDELPTPDFDQVRFADYLSPHITLPLAITRGCYYEKCVFCTLYKVIGPGYRQRKLERILDDIEQVTTRYGSRYVYFVVEDMPPVLFRKLPAALASRNLDIRWWTDARLERDLYTPELCRDLYASGCRRIAFGFESASQRVLDLMDKGTAIAEADGIVRNVADAGIAVVLYTMIGFPTETAEEAYATLEWIRSHQPWIQEVSLRIFYIDLLSTVYAHPERFDITRIIADAGKDYQVYYDHDCRSGLDRGQARRIFFDFMEVVRTEFPLFAGDNLWLFELKTHHFLYLCQAGSLDVFHGRTVAGVARAVPAALETACPRLADAVKVVDLPYDLLAMSKVLLDAEDATLRPRYQSGSFKTEMFDQLAGSTPHFTAATTPIVWRGETSDLLRVGRDSAQILRRLDGRTAVTAILADYPAARREQVLAFVRSLFDKGLIEADPVPARTRREALA